jgi:hypothetical protein
MTGSWSYIPAAVTASITVSSSLTWGVSSMSQVDEWGGALGSGANAHFRGGTTCATSVSGATVQFHETAFPYTGTTITASGGVTMQGTQNIAASSSVTFAGNLVFGADTTTIPDNATITCTGGTVTFNTSIYNAVATGTQIRIFDHDIAATGTSGFDPFAISAQRGGSVRAGGGEHHVQRGERRLKHRAAAAAIMQRVTVPTAAAVAAASAAAGIGGAWPLLETQDRPVPCEAPHGARGAGGREALDCGMQAWGREHAWGANSMGGSRGGSGPE